MKTWQEFNDSVNDMLLIDGLRRGRGVERFKDRMIVAGTKDLQGFIPAYMATPTERVFSESEFELHSEGNSSTTEFDVDFARVLDFRIRVLPTEDNPSSVFYKPNLYAGYDRHVLTSGNHSRRTPAYPGKIAFDRGLIYLAPPIQEGEVLSILYNYEVQYKPLFECSADEKAQKTPFGDDAALAVHYFVKYHFHKDVNDDQKQAQDNYKSYTQERRKLHWKMKEFISNTDNATTPALPEDGFIIG